eukprot:COSAG06_NODE_48285_length_333_cov_0.756410_1_plen_35_part_01
MLLWHALRVADLIPSFHSHHQRTLPTILTPDVRCV